MAIFPVFFKVFILTEAVFYDRMLSTSHSYSSYPFNLQQDMVHTFVEELKAIHYMLFYPGTKSFDILAHTTEDGTWQASYTQHVSTQRKIRWFSASSLVVVVTATVVSNYVLSFIF